MPKDFLVIWTQTLLSGVVTFCNGAWEQEATTPQNKF